MRVELVLDAKYFAYENKNSKKEEKGQNLDLISITKSCFATTEARVRSAHACESTIYRNDSLRRTFRLQTRNASVTQRCMSSAGLPERLAAPQLADSLEIS